MTDYRVTIQEDENGEAYIVIPAEILDKYGLEVGDLAVFECDGEALKITFPDKAKPCAAE